MRISDWSSDVCSSDLASTESLCRSCWREDQIARDDDPHREAGPDRERRRNVELAPNDFLTGLIDAVLRTGAQRTDQSVVASRSELKSEEHTSELQSLMRISYAVFCLKTKKTDQKQTTYI